MESESPGRQKLIGMMFGQYMIMGVWVVTLGPFLMASPLQGGLGFSAVENGWIYSSFAIAGMLAPLISGLLADRLFSAQRVMGYLNLLGAGLLALAAWWCDVRFEGIRDAFLSAAASQGVTGDQIAALDSGTKQAIYTDATYRGVVRETFLPLMLITLAYCFCNMLSLTMCSVIGMRNLADPKRQFGRIRLWGTIGWVIGGIQIALFWTPNSPMPLYVAAFVSLCFGVYAFFLPNTPPLGEGKTIAQTFGVPALGIFRDRSVCILLAACFMISGVQQVYSVYCNQFLQDLKIPRPAAVQAIAQVSEVVCMAIYPLLIVRWGIKTTLLIGICGWVLRNALFAINEPWVVVALGLPLHGVCFTLFFMVAQVYVDHKAPQKLRASAQAIFMFFGGGVGTLLGNLVASRIVQSYTHGGTTEWTVVWLVPAVTAAVVAVVFAVFFRSTYEEGAIDETMSTLLLESNKAEPANHETQPARVEAPVLAKT